MKKTLLVGFLLYCGYVRAQQYTFECLEGTYQSLTEATSVSNGLDWTDSMDIYVPMGFDFTMGNYTFSTLYIFNGYFFDGDNFVLINGYNAIFFPLGTRLADRAFTNLPNDDYSGFSPIVYRVDGNPGSRIFKLEYQNVGFTDELIHPSAPQGSYAYFQVWLYEGTNILEFHYGPSVIINPQVVFWTFNNGPFISVIPELELIKETVIDGIGLVGDADCPTVIPIEGLFQNFINTIPPVNKIYRFIPTTLATPGVTRNRSLVMYPNPVQDELKFNHPDNLQVHSITIRTLLGQPVLEFDNPNPTLSVQGLASGTYLVEFYTSLGKQVERLLKKVSN